MLKHQGRSSKSLILITSHFPYGFGEAFLSHELPHLLQYFDKVVIMARDVMSPAVRDISAYEVVRVNPVSSASEKLMTPFHMLRHADTVGRYLRREISALKSAGKQISGEVISIMLHDLLKACVTAHHIRSVIKAFGMKGDIIIYSYWLNSSALAATLVKNSKIKCISRAHGGDIYESRHPSNYLSFRSILLEELDSVFTISESGKEHLQASALAGVGRLAVSRLGTRPPGSLPEPREGGPFVIVSCSFMVPVKRLDLMVRSLAEIQEIEIKWIHIGDGPLFESIVDDAKRYLDKSPNITYEFRGALTNPELLEFYTNNYVDVFLNTSSSEGIPVTMMEAQSFQIPVVALNVGGVSEIVSHENGRLLSADAGPNDIASAIKQLLLMDEQGKQTIRRSAFRNWSARYNADNNFPTFVAEILKL